jgi:glycosyltransferase involved in cell wall biosynthesis
MYEVFRAGGSCWPSHTYGVRHDLVSAPNPEPELTSVIIPVRNEEDHIGVQLAALAAQTYRGQWELVIVDNGCTDRSMDVARSWGDRLPSLRIVSASAKRGLNYARNVGAAAAHGDLLAFCDGDDAAMPRWLESLAAAAASADLIGGSFGTETLNDEATSETSDDSLVGLPIAFGFRTYVPGGNCAVWASVARELRWNEDFRFGSSDVEFSWRAQFAGYALGFAPDAVMRRRYPAEAGAAARQYFLYGISVPLLYRHFGVAGMPGSELSEALRTWRWLICSSPRALRSSQFRGRWLRVAGLRSGRVVGSIRRRVLYL